MGEEFQKENYVIVFSDGTHEWMYGTSNEVLDYAESKSNKFSMYNEEEYEKTYGPLKSNSNLLDRMQSGGEGKIKEKSNDEPENGNDSYKQWIIDTIQKLQDSGDEIFGQAINLAMKGERQDLNERFETDDEVRFYMEDLESVNDINVQKLVALLESMEETIRSLENINGLNEDDSLN